MNPNGHRKKIFSLAVKATKIFFAIALCKPCSGLIYL